MTRSSLTLLLFVPTLAVAGTIPVDVPEPSAIDADYAGDRLFVADDGGEIWVYDGDFTHLDTFDVGGDLEGVDYLPRADVLLVAVEGDEQLLVLDPRDGTELAVLDIPRTYKGETILAAGGNGIETLTVVDSRIFVANQAFDLDDTDDGSVLVELALDRTGDLEIVAFHPLPFRDAAGSLYAAATDELFVLSDTDDRVYRVPMLLLDALPAGAPLPEALPSFEVPGVDQEGIVLWDECLLIAQDSGDLYDAGPLAALLSPGAPDGHADE